MARQSAPAAAAQAKKPAAVAEAKKPAAVAASAAAAEAKKAEDTLSVSSGSDSPPSVFGGSDIAPRDSAASPPATPEHNKQVQANSVVGRARSSDWLSGITKDSDDEEEAEEESTAPAAAEKAKESPTASDGACSNCGHKHEGCDHDNYSFSAYNREENMGYFKDGAKYAGYSCCNCYGYFVVKQSKKKGDPCTPSMEDTPAESVGTIAVTSKIGVYMCKMVTGDCRHMFCVDCFNMKQGLVGKECQWAEGIGVAARTERRKRGCTQKKK